MASILGTLVLFQRVFSRASIRYPFRYFQDDHPVRLCIEFLSLAAFLSLLCKDVADLVSVIDRGYGQALMLCSGVDGN